MPEIRVRGRTLVEHFAATPKRRSTFERPLRLAADVYARHNKTGGIPVHDYAADGRCQVRGCDIYDPSEAEVISYE